MAAESDFVIKTIPSCRIWTNLAVRYGHVLRMNGVTLEGFIGFEGGVNLLNHIFVSFLQVRTNLRIFRQMEKND